MSTLTIPFVKDGGSVAMNDVSMGIGRKKRLC